MLNKKTYLRNSDKVMYQKVLFTYLVTIADILSHYLTQGFHYPVTTILFTQSSTYLNLSSDKMYLRLYKQFWRKYSIVDTRAEQLINIIIIATQPSEIPISKGCNFFVECKMCHNITLYMKRCAATWAVFTQTIFLNSKWGDQFRHWCLHTTISLKSFWTTKHQLITNSFNYIYIMLQPHFCVVSIAVVVTTVRRRI